MRDDEDAVPTQLVTGESERELSDTCARRREDDTMRSRPAVAQTLDETRHLRAATHEIVTHDVHAIDALDDRHRHVDDRHAHHALDAAGTRRRTRARTRDLAMR